MGRRIPRDLRNIGWSCFLFWVAVANAAVVLLVGSGCLGRVVACAKVEVSPVKAGIARDALRHAVGGRLRIFLGCSPRCCRQAR
jgi:hypothetical protein